VSRTWGGDFDLLNDIETAKSIHSQNRQDARDALYRAGQAYQEGHHPEKTDLELEDEAGDAEALRQHARETVLGFARKEFYSARQAEANATAVAPPITTGNPWHDNVAKTMFWM
jgi:hypothetical protein